MVFDVYNTTAIFIGNATNDFYLKLKESLLILKMKPSLNIAQESIPLLLFEDDS